MLGPNLLRPEAAVVVEILAHIPGDIILLQPWCLVSRLDFGSAYISCNAIRNNPPTRAVGLTHNERTTAIALLLIRKLWVPTHPVS